MDALSFTFHYGEIKSEVINIVIGKPGSFTFHCGEIKSRVFAKLAATMF